MLTANRKISLKSRAEPEQLLVAVETVSSSAPTLCWQTGVKAEQEESVAGGLGGFYGSKHIRRNTRTQTSPRERGTAARNSVVHFICRWV